MLCAMQCYIINIKLYDYTVSKNPKHVTFHYYRVIFMTWEVLISFVTFTKIVLIKIIFWKILFLSSKYCFVFYVYYDLSNTFRSFCSRVSIERSSSMIKPDSWCCLTACFTLVAHLIFIQMVVRLLALRAKYIIFLSLILIWFSSYFRPLIQIPLRLIWTMIFRLQMQS